MDLRKFVDALRPLPGWIGGGILDWYQLGLRKPRDATTYYGATFHCDPVDSIQRSIIYYGVWEPAISRIIESSLAPGDLFVDIGANIGYDTMLAATRADVVAIEAAPHIYRKLLHNLDRNPELAGRVRPVNLAVSDRVGELDLYDFGPRNIGATTTLPSRNGKKCATVTAAPLLDILSAEELARVRLMKIDVEGAETTILNDVFDHIDAFPENMSIIFEANPEDDQSAFDVLFKRIQQNFAAYEVENGYSNAWYLKWREHPLTEIRTAPVRRTDILLTRA
ncbi:FkbM family methyltransferase [Mycolicibacterium mucogenicum]|uniref:FkbM family methyltransferase n=1 Tax=Mycolicibacterium mucogenicum TaxID=56689 RepID=UPI00226AFE36|nr:FkbM family methyltransferase [Mycolicibacterium mucogenicum]MCX8561843.1 FkbM family methyltransferase [Mycolicibacterium mucogenicum]